MAERINPADKGTPEGQSTPKPSRTKQGDRLKAELDELLDEIDDVLEDNAEEFVRSHVQKGHQGWSGFTDPSFFVGAATASLLAAVGWDGFKAVIGRAVRALRHVPGGGYQFVRPDGSLDPYFEQTMREAWQVAEAVVRNDEPMYTIDEAMALHWTLFFIELQRSNPVIRVDPSTLAQVRSAVDSEMGYMSPSEVVDIAVSYWMTRTQGGEHDGRRAGKAHADKPARKPRAGNVATKTAPSNPPAKKPAGKAAGKRAARKAAPKKAADKLSAKKAAANAPAKKPAGKAAGKRAAAPAKKGAGKAAGKRAPAPAKKPAGKAAGKRAAAPAKKGAGKAAR